jgi:hypothetical protein
MCFVCELIPSSGSSKLSISKLMRLAENMMPFFVRAVNSAKQSIYFPDKVRTDRIHLNSTSDCEIRRTTDHANLPLARLREREGPAAKRWEGEGARSPATTSHEAARTPSHPRSNPINSSSLSLALASLPSSSSAAIWRLSL